jgi:hypothetical protein
MYMLDRRRRLAASLLAVGLLAATLFAADALASPSPAEARCMGQGNPVYSWFSYGGGVAASETPGAGTCNGNNIYSGVIKDERQDGYCAVVEFKEGNGGWTLPDSGGAVCGRGNTATFQYRDRNNNSRVYEHLCLLGESSGDFICGWGTQVGAAYYATNWGY